MLLWTTDTHFDFLDRLPSREVGIKYFCEYILKNENPAASGLIITGDISNGEFLCNNLKTLAENFPKPIYFILGNHDYYYSSFGEIDKKVGNLSQKINNIHWLEKGYVIHNRLPIIGVGGWYDAYHGNVNGGVVLNDWFEINNLAPVARARDLLIQQCRDRTKKHTENLGKMLEEVVKNEQSNSIIICTHVPPFPESSVYQGKQSGPGWLPWFTNETLGRLLVLFAEEYTNKTFIVLCGHSHGSGFFEKRNNLVIFTGRARYGFPDLAGFVDISSKVIHAFDCSNNNLEFKFR